MNRGPLGFVAAEVPRLLGCGLSPDDIVSEIGIQRESIIRNLQRNGLDNVAAKFMTGPRRV